MEHDDNFKGIKHIFIPQTVSFDNIDNYIDSNNIVMKNDIYEKYKVNLNVEGEYIRCTDIEMYNKSNGKKYKNYKLKKETYQEYIDLINSRDPNIDKWIYNIIDGFAEQDNILFKDDECVIIPNYTFNVNDPLKSYDKLHILTIPMDKTLRCIRSLTSEHVTLLKFMKLKTVDIIYNFFGIKEESLKIFLHYNPSTYHLHIHFVNILFTDCNSSVEYSHDLDLVIFNLELDGDYYKKVLLKIKC